ncbi:hypothetical protein RDI58_024112 [Solanum bulbocastanum]|uniref:Uncharacterized protein n=1 Tax=Solanum bulbocastanum TaxID=147425 RepID=A0AAN8SX32_SOLBU
MLLLNVDPNPTQQKFPQKIVHTVGKKNAPKENENGIGQIIYSKIINLWPNTWRSFFPCESADNNIDKNKPN